MSRPQDVANYFLATLGTDKESDITNMKLQKLCAYAQALSLGLFGKTLFSENMQAWHHGPVIPSLYEKYKNYGGAVIDEIGLSPHWALAPFNDNEKFVLELARHYYGSYSAHQLRERSHMDFPGEFGSMRQISEYELEAVFRNNPLVSKILEQSIDGRFNPDRDELIDAQEVWDALEI